jgi:hypothetical protein
VDSSGPEIQILPSDKRWESWPFGKAARATTALPNFGASSRESVADGHFRITGVSEASASSEPLPSKSATCGLFLCKSTNLGKQWRVELRRFYNQKAIRSTIAKRNGFNTKHMS